MSWHDEYLRGLQERNDLELRSKTVYDHYSRLAERIAILEKNAQQAPAAGGSAAQTSASPSRNEGPRGQVKSDPLNSDLADAQRARSQLEAKLKDLRQEFEGLNTTSAGEKQHIKELTTENTSFATKLRDRDEELREKSKLLDNVHDEMLALTMQLNVMEEHNQKLKKENQDLVDRWMARMGQEADAMNDASRFS